MEGYIKPIGGEHIFDIDILDKNRNNLQGIEAVFLSGGQSTIRFIVEDLSIKENEYILIPSYLCPTMLYILKEKNIKYDFYKINKDLSIDINDINLKLNKIKAKAVLFINYFGFYYNKATLDFFNKLKENNIKIIEDSVQMLWIDKENFIGDYVFNSYRKFLPVDGSLVICKTKKIFKEVQDDYYKYINKARLTKTLYTSFNIGIENDFLELYEKSEEEYYKRSEIYGMNTISKKILSKVDIDYIRKKRADNYSYLHDEFENIKEIDILFHKNKINNIIPVGFPIIINNRNYIRNELRKNHIFCPVHWNILNEKWAKHYEDSIYISQNILTIPIDQRYDYHDMDRIVKTIKNIIQEI